MPDAAKTHGAGLLLAGRYRLLRELGAGGFGSVWEAADEKTCERVALKELRRMDAASLYRFKQEFRSLADMVHPNLVGLRELHGTGDLWFFTMNLVEGVDFLSYVRGAGRADESKVSWDAMFDRWLGGSDARRALREASARTVDASSFLSSEARTATIDISLLPARAPELVPVIAPAIATFPLPAFAADLGRLEGALRQLVAGVSALHAAGKLHCDLKPTNVLVRGDGRLVILDFGLVTDERGASIADLELAGTPTHMAPEHALGGKVSPASDWYSVGIMLFEALTGHLPFEGSAMEILRAKAVRDGPDPRLFCAGVPDGLASLCCALTRLDPTERPGGAEILAEIDARPAPSSSSGVSDAGEVPLALAALGRERHLAALHEARARKSATGRALVVHLHGASGMGKSALLRTFLGELRRSGSVVLEGRCYERESVPFNAFDSLVDALTGHLGRLGPDELDALAIPDLAMLARLFPVLRNVPAIARAAAHAADVVDVAEQRGRAIRALRGLLAALASTRELTLSIDDLQWGDADSAALLSDLLREPGAPAVLWVASYRSEPRSARGILAALPPAEAADGRAVEVALGPLSLDEARAVATAMLAERPARLSPEQIARESGGSLFFLQELVRHATRAQAEDEDASASAAPGRTLDALLGARLARLSPASRALLEAVALMGEPIAEATALAAAAVETGKHEATTALRAAGVLQRSAAAGAEALEIVHERVRAAVLERIDPSELRDRYLRLAVALEADGGTDPEAVGRHFRAAGDVARAIHHTRRAADRAGAALAFDRAVTLYRAALELARPGEESELREKLGDALVNAGRGAEAAEVYVAAITGQDRRRDLDLRRRAAEHFLRSGRVDKGIAALRSVLSEVGLTLPSSPQRALASLVAARAALWWRGLDHDTVDERAADPDALLRIDACAAAAMGLAMVDVLRSVDFQTRQLLLALSAGEPSRLSLALVSQAMGAVTGGAKARPKVDLLLAKARELNARAPRPDVDAISVAVEGVAAFVVGEWRTAHEHLAEAEKRMRERCVGIASSLTTVQLFSIATYFYLGRLRELSERVPRYLEDAARRGDLYALVNFRVATGNLVWVLRDEPARARREAREALASWSQEGFLLQHWYALRSETQIDLYEGRGRDAYARVAAAWRPLLRSLITRAEHVYIETYAMRGRTALAAAADGLRTRQLLAEAEADARRIERVGGPWARCLAGLIRAGAAATRGDRELAVEGLRRTIAACDAADMALHAAAARVRLGEALGGEAGRAEIERGAERMHREGVRAPERMTDMLAPGLRALRR